MVRNVRYWIPIARAAVVGATGLAIAGSIVWGWGFGLSRSNSDQTTLVSAVVALAAFVLVAVGIVVAVITYMVTTGAPRLEPEIIFRFSDPNRPVFQLDDAPAQSFAYITRYRQVEGRVFLHNRSKYSARNPGFRISFEGLGGFEAQSNPGWTVIAAVNQLGPTSIQWDGGADYLVHGNWTRPLPDLSFNGVFCVNPPDATMLVTVAADGFLPRDWRLLVRCLNESAYQTYSTERAKQFTEPVSDGRASRRGWTIARRRRDVSS